MLWLGFLPGLAKPPLDRWLSCRKRTEESISFCLASPAAPACAEVALATATARIASAIVIETICLARVATRNGHLSEPVVGGPAGHVGEREVQLVSGSARQREGGVGL